MASPPTDYGSQVLLQITRRSVVQRGVGIGAVEPLLPCGPVPARRTFIMLSKKRAMWTKRVSYGGDGLVSADAYHGPGRGSSNAEERWHKAAQALAHGRQRNRDAGAVILVEGRRDRLALERLGFTGPIEVLNRGWSVDDVLVYLVETYGRKSGVDGGSSIIVLMDWDRTCLLYTSPSPRD